MQYTFKMGADGEYDIFDSERDTHVGTILFHSDAKRIEAALKLINLINEKAEFARLLHAISEA